MDVTALIFYAIVCGLLSLASPTMDKPLTRLAIGALVGIAAAALLPALRGLFGLP
jgi:ABC-type transport system involved in cytochrome c biogenesis permease component